MYSINHLIRFINIGFVEFYILLIYYIFVEIYI